MNFVHGSIFSLAPTIKNQTYPLVIGVNKYSLIANNDFSVSCQVVFMKTRFVCFKRTYAEASFRLTSLKKQLERIFMIEHVGIYLLLFSEAVTSYFIWVNWKKRTRKKCHYLCDKYSLTSFIKFKPIFVQNFHKFPKLIINHFIFLVL